jgi:hypothetical protein
MSRSCWPNAASEFDHRASDEPRRLRPDEALDRLRQISQTENMKLHTVATHIRDEPSERGHDTRP